MNGVSSYVLIPAYNEAGMIGSVVERVPEQCDTIRVVDDGSTDGTGACAREAGAVVLSHGDNEGKGEALKTGFRDFLDGSWEYLVMLDADGQHDPGKIPYLLEEILASNDALLIGSRTSRLDDLPGIRPYTNKLLRIFISGLVGQVIGDTQSGFRVLTRDTVRELTLTGSSFELESEMIIEAGLNGLSIGEREVGLPRMPGADSKWNPVEDYYRIIRLLFHYYTGGLVTKPV
jgi:glycosyltransferase involved in cell wall biosynthesis